MSYIVKDIEPSQLKHYTTTSRNCSFGNICTISGRQGLLSLDFSSYSAADRCVLTFRRKSGNGKVTVISGSSVVESDIVSKKSQYISIALDKSRMVNIKRPTVSNGDLELLKTQLYSDIKQIYTAKDWRDVLSKCNSYSSLRVVDGKLFASEGAMIKTSGINGISTSPPNMYRINNNTIRFPASCEIITLDIAGDYNKAALPLDIQKAKYSSMHVVPKVLTVPGVVPPEIFHSSNFKTQLNIPKVDFNNKNILFDSSKHKGLINITKDGKFAGDSHAFSLGRNGRAEINLTNLNPNTEYIIVLDISRAGGNGKILSYIEPTKDKTNILFASANKKAMTISFYTKESSKDGSFKLVVERPGSSTGEILVNRVMLIYGLQLAKAITNNFNHKHITPTKIADIPIVNRHSIEHISKAFATVPTAQYKPEVVFNNLKGIIRPITYSANSWLSKISPLIPNVIISSTMLDHTKVVEQEPDLLISHLGRLSPCKRIWLEEFQGAGVSQIDIGYLQETEKVLSSSLPNVQYLSNILGNDKVDYLPKVWAYTRPTPVKLPKNYVVYFNRNPLFTDELFNEYDFSNLPKMVILGARGNFPQAVASFSEYVEYSKLLYILQNASCIIDLPVCNHYMSAILDFALISGVPVVTTNHWLSIGKPTCNFISSKLKDGILCPEYHGINPAVQSAVMQKTKPKFDMTSYNLNLYSSLGIALGVL